MFYVILCLVADSLCDILFYILFSNPSEHIQRWPIASKSYSVCRERKREKKTTSKETKKNSREEIIPHDVVTMRPKCTSYSTQSLPTDLHLLSKSKMQTVNSFNFGIASFSQRKHATLVPQPNKYLPILINNRVC